jgi:aspartate/methionine/tyrosine aminotransferase
VLSDEAYWDIRYAGDSLSIASLPGMTERTVILYTFSKKFAMTGWRLGGAIGPREVISVIATLNVNEESCTNHFVQFAGVEALTGDQSGARKILGVLQERRDLAVELLNSIPGVTCYSPTATFYLFPDVTGAMERVGAADYDQFRTAALEKTGCSFCTRLHFGRALPGETRHYVRIAYSGIDTDQIREGLGLLKEWIES